MTHFIQIFELERYFFYLKIINKKYHLTHLVWTSYQQYLLDKYDIPTIPFIDINHHCKTLIIVPFIGINHHRRTLVSNANGYQLYLVVTYIQDDDV